MAQVALDINGRRFEVACDDGQEPHLRALGAEIDQRVRTLVESVGQVGEMRLLVMAGLLLADDLDEQTGQVTGRTPARQPSAEDARTVERLNAVAERVERVAARFEGA